MIFKAELKSTLLLKIGTGNFNEQKIGSLAHLLQWISLFQTKTMNINEFQIIFHLLTSSQIIQYFIHELSLLGFLSKTFWNFYFFNWFKIYSTPRKCILVLNRTQTIIKYWTSKLNYPFFRCETTHGSATQPHTNFASH